MVLVCAESRTTESQAAPRRKNKMEGVPQHEAKEGLLRILIVEDDRRLVRGMEGSLSASGYAVDTITTGEEAIEVAAAEPYSTIILDLGLPDMDGLEVLRALRRRSIVTPILILTARDAIGDRIAGLDGGADDYLSKPFHPRELESRVRALIRRSLGSPDPVLRVGTLTFDRSTRRVHLKNAVVELRRREMAVLETLMGRPGKVIGKDRLSAEVFNFSDAVAPNALEVYVGRLRRKLMPDGPAIRTIRGLGYMIDAD
jgi:two-component system response regulator TctD